MLRSLVFPWFGLAGIAWLLGVGPLGPASPAAAQDRPAPSAGERAQPPIDFQRARALMQKRNRGEALTPEEAASLERALAARRAGAPGAPGSGQRRIPGAPRESTGLIPLTEMSADDRYEGQDGGLYGQGRNTPPEALRTAALHELQQIVPRDREGRPSPEGKIVFISISMSNATQEFSRFKQLSDQDPQRNPHVVVVDCAQGGQAMAEWAPRDARPWTVALQRLEQAGVTPPQVQVAWVKLANKGPQGSLEEHGRKLQRDTQQVLQNARERFPNLRIVYLGSRIYGGYSAGALNPEPYAYESAFVVRWLIDAQSRGEPELNWEASRGEVRAPLLLWGPYLWGDGATPRKSDQLVWLREDFAGDGTHPSASGRDKVARMLLEFCRQDPLARTWYTGQPAP
jgi:hypothetical protein